MNTFLDILERLKELEDFRFDAQVCELLGSTKTQLNNWKTRNTIPYEKLFTYCESREVSMNWLLSGEGPVHLMDKEMESLRDENQSLKDEVKKIDEILEQDSERCSRRNSSDPLPGIEGA